MSALVDLPRRRQIPAGTRIAVLGRPNSGKTTLFNRLAGTSLQVGNYPGVTVEGIRSRVTLGDGTIELEDLPGTYSLCGHTPEERIAIGGLLGLDRGGPPDAVLLVTDATQLEQQLYLALQVLELGLPTLVALSFSDEARVQHVDIDLAALQEWLGAPVVVVSGQTGEGIDELRSRLAAVAASGRAEHPPLPLTAPIRAAVDAVKPSLPAAWTTGQLNPDAVALWALQSIEGDEGPLGAAVAAARAGLDVDSAIAAARWESVELGVKTCLREAGGTHAATDRIDSVLVHPVYGLAIFLGLMTLLFQGLFTWSDPAIGLIETFFGVLGGAVEASLPAGILRDFVVEGLIGGVGSVLVFLPQILLLFALIGLLEDSGYMARVAYLMDRLMKSVGLNGRAFVPLLSGFACAVPAILATRTLERRRDRVMTMMVIPLTTCAARLPVYTLVIAALFPVTAGGVPLQGLLMAAMYLLGIGSALIVAAVLGRTILKGERAPLLLELPPYRRPRASTVWRMTWSRTKVFLTDAGTVILACTVILWFLLSFPKVDPSTLAADVDPATVQLHGSYGAQLGKALEPVIAPLGFDWKIGVGLVGSFAAREVFVATMGVVYGLGDEVDEGSTTLRERIRQEERPDGGRVYSPLVGLSLMVFFALSAQCMSTLAAVKRETRSWRWPAFLFAYMTALAWIASLLVYQGGRLLGFG